MCVAFSLSATYHQGLATSGALFYLGCSESVMITNWYKRLVQMSIMSSPQRHPSSGIYYLRKSVPRELVSIIGKTVFKESLKTSNLSEAKRLIVSRLENADNQIALARLKLAGAGSHMLTVRDCVVIATRWYEHSKKEVEESGKFEEFLEYQNNQDEYPHFFGLSDTLSLQGSEVVRATDNEWRQLAIELSEHIDSQLTREGIVIAHSSDDYIKLAKEFHSHLLHLEAVCLSRHKRNWSHEPINIKIAREKLSNEVTTKLLTDINPNCESVISKVYTQFRESDLLVNKANKTREKTLDETRGKIERYVAILGDLDVRDITRSHIAQYRDKLLQLPKSKNVLIRSKSITEQIAIAKARQLPLVSATTVNNALKQISTVFSYAVEVGLIPINPVLGVRVKKTQKQTEVEINDRGYSSEEIRRLFAADLFVSYSSELTYGLACCWIPLICKYTGARLNEIAQLHYSDICIKDGIHYFNIRRGDGQSIKTDSSLRHIPISDHLIELGFLKYVDKSKGSLFPDIPKGTYGKPSIAFSKWWSRFVNSKNITIRQPAHAFRHSFKTEMRSLGIEDSVSDAITGHAAKTEGGRYGSVPLSTKKEAIDKLTRLDVFKVY